MIYLTRIEPGRNMFRHFAIERSGSRVCTQSGRLGLQRSFPYHFTDEQAAIAFVRAMIRQKLRKGYNLGHTRQPPLFRKKRPQLGGKKRLRPHKPILVGT